MQITYTGRNIEITEALRSYAEEKLKRKSKHSDQIMSIHFIFLIESTSSKEQQQVAEAVVSLRGKTVNATAASEDMYKSIDLVLDKVDRQLIKYRDKLKSL